MAGTSDAPPIPALTEGHWMALQITVIETQNVAQLTGDRMTGHMAPPMGAQVGLLPSST